MFMILIIAIVFILIGIMFIHGGIKNSEWLYHFPRTKGAPDFARIRFIIFGALFIAMGLIVVLMNLI